MSETCQCGHPEMMHGAFLGQPACTGSVDARHRATGGDTLTPCQCKGFVPLLDVGTERSSSAVERIDWLLGCVRDELVSATSKHAPMHSGHEGYAVILEELDELWAHVKADTGHGTAAMEEAIQIAAMALRYVHDLAMWGPGVLPKPLGQADALPLHKGFDSIRETL